MEKELPGVRDEIRTLLIAAEGELANLGNENPMVS
jgi:hypothetical protein